FSSIRRHTISKRDWSSDVCSSDLEIYMQWGFNEEAITILTNLISKYPRENEIKIMLADLYIENNQDEQAMVLLNEIPEEGDAYKIGRATCREREQIEVRADGVRET